MEENKQFPVKWLWVLFYIHLAGLALSVLPTLATLLQLSVGSWYAWAQRAVSLAATVCLFALSGRYRIAGMAGVLSLLCSIVSLAFFRLLYAYGVQLEAADYGVTINVLSRASTVLTLVALFLEYTAHAQAVPADRNKWHIFLACRLAVTLLAAISVFLLQPLLNQMVNSGETWLMELWNVLAQLVNLAIAITYLVLLYRAIHVREKE